MDSSHDIMTHSPLDATSGLQLPITSRLVTLQRATRAEWVPSRFNARTVDEPTGRLVLWNTYTTSISVFDMRHRDTIDKLLSQRGFSGELTGLAKYLFDRGFLIARGTDELRRVRHLFGRQQYRTDVLQLILLASEDCNFRCTYCYEDFARGTMRPNVRAAIKTMVRKRARQLRQIGVSWFGGEPLYGFEALEDLSPFFCEVADEFGLAYVAQMTTNAYLLTPDVATKLLNWRILEYQITVDGLAEDHDCKRVGRDGRGTFEVIYQNLRALKARDDAFNVILRVNYDQQNYPHLEAFTDLLSKDFGGDRRFRLVFHPIGKWGGPNDASIEECGTEEVSDVYGRMLRAAEEKGLFIGDGVKEVNRPGEQVCYAARPYNLIVGATGKLMKCTIALDKEDYNVVGHLNDDGETVIDQDKMALWTEPAFEKDTVCQSCYVLPGCQGLHCPLHRMQTGNRSCCGTKANLHGDLMKTVNSMTIESGRQVTVR